MFRRSPQNYFSKENVYFFKYHTIDCLHERRGNIMTARCVYAKATDAFRNGIGVLF